jgi:hypothetical protein
MVNSNWINHKINSAFKFQSFELLNFTFIIEF